MSPGLQVELVLLPAVTFLATLTIVAGKDPRTRQVASMTGCLMAIVGVGIAVYVIVNVVSKLDQVTTKNHFAGAASPSVADHLFPSVSVRD